MRAPSALLPPVHLNMVLDDTTSERLTRFVVRLAAHIATLADQEVLCGRVQAPTPPPTGAGPVGAGGGRQVASKDTHSHSGSHSGSHSNSSNPFDSSSNPFDTVTTAVALYDTKGTNDPWGNTATGGYNNPGGYTTPGGGAMTAEEEVLARRDALVRCFEASFVHALREGSGHTNVSERSDRHEGEG